MKHPSELFLIFGLFVCTTAVQAQTVSDIDGNVYKTVTIGTQVWMAENLRTSKFNDGTSIPLVEDSIAWSSLTTPGYCWYKNNEAEYKATHGALYNWYCVITGKLCPTGWHVLRDAEWTALDDYLTNNGYGYGGSGRDIAKSMASKSGWVSFGQYDAPGYIGYDQASNNSSGLTVQPSGMRRKGFIGIGWECYFWTSNEPSTQEARSTFISFSTNSAGMWYSAKKHEGLSVRCIKD